jgi:hypothetical protein
VSVPLGLMRQGYVCIIVLFDGKNLGCRVQSWQFTVQVLRSKVCSLQFQLWKLGLGVQGSGFRVLVLGSSACK